MREPQSDSHLAHLLLKGRDPEKVVLSRALRRHIENRVLL
jgi:formyltetrahydrofolate hydrolase